LRCGRRPGGAVADESADSNASTTTDLPGAVISNPDPNMVNGKPMNHHPDQGSHSDTFNDPGGWNRASYTPDFLDEIEPLPDVPNDYRQAALYHLQLMYAVDEFLMAPKDARFAVIVVAVVLRLAVDPGLDRSRDCRTVGYRHVNDRPGLHAVPRNVRTQFRRRRSARCRIIERRKPPTVRS
jgi:hypothetical protein